MGRIHSIYRSITHGAYGTSKAYGAYGTSGIN